MQTTGQGRGGQKTPQWTPIHSDEAALGYKLRSRLKQPRKNGKEGAKEGWRRVCKHGCPVGGRNWSSRRSAVTGLREGRLS